MKTVDVPGMGLVEFPDTMSDAEIAAAIQRNMPAQAKYPPVMETIKGMLFPEWARNAAGGAVRGAGSIGATLMTPYDLAAGNTKSIGNPERRQAMTGGLQELGVDTESAPFQAGKLATEVAGTMGVGGLLGKAGQALGMSGPVAEALLTSGFRAGGATGLPGLLARAAGGATSGAASAGLINPLDAATGAMIGGALPAAAQTAGMVGRAAGAALRPDDAKTRLARAAVDQYGIPLSVSDVSSNQIIKGTRSALDDVPVIGRIGAKQKEAVQAAYNKAVGQTFGANSDSLSPPVIDAAKQRMGAEFDRLWNRNTLSYDAPLFQEIQALRRETTKLPQGEAGRLSSWLDDIESKMVPDQNGNLYMPGDVANRLQSKLRRDAESASGFLKNSLSGLRQSLIGAFNRNVSPADAAALTMNRGQWKAFKTVEELLQKGEAGTAGRSVGDVPAALLPEAVRKSYRSGISSSPFADLSQIGSQFIADRVARTGGSARAAMQNFALGSGLTLGAQANPLALLGIPAAAGIEGLLSSPALGRTLLGAPGPSLLTQPMYQAAPALFSDQ